MSSRTPLSGFDLQFDVTRDDPAEVHRDQSRHILAAGDGERQLDRPLILLPQLLDQPRGGMVRQICDGRCILHDHRGRHDSGAAKHADPQGSIAP